jgi:hypothetical protein
MRAVSVVLKWVVVASLAVVAAAIGTMWLLSSKAVMAQRIKPHDPVIAELLGEVGTPIGSPQPIVLLDRSAVLDQEGPNGVVLLNDDKLAASRRYPLQRQTVWFVGSLVAEGAGASAFLSFVAYAFVRRRIIQKAAVTEAPTPS